MNGPGGLVEVRLLELPLVLRERSRQHGADLLREMTLLQAGRAARDGGGAGDGTCPAGPDRGPPGAPTGVVGTYPARLLELAAKLETVYGPYVAASNAAMDDALDEGRTSLDVAQLLPPEAAPLLAAVRSLLAEAEQYCASDDYLLTLAPPPEVAGYRAWSIEQVLAQLGGAPPTAWPVWARTHGLV